MELTFTWEAEIPKSSRTSVGRSATEWEKHLNPVRASKLNKPPLVFKFWDKVDEDGKLIPAKSQAQSRVSSISARLRKVVPLEKWSFTVRTLPNTSECAGIWIKYDGVMTSDEYEEYETRRKQRGEKIRLGRLPKTDETADSMSPADRIKAARKNKVAEPV